MTQLQISMESSSVSTSQSPNLTIISPRNRPRTKTQTFPKIQYKGITLKQYFRLYDQSIDHSTIEELNEQQIQSSSSSLAQTPQFGNNKREHANIKKNNQLNTKQYSNNLNKINLNLNNTINGKDVHNLLMTGKNLNMHKLKIKTQANEYENQNEQEYQNYELLNSYNNISSINNNLNLTNKNLNNISLDQTKKLTKMKKNSSSIQKLNPSIIRKISCMKKPQKRQQKIKTLGVEEIDRSTLNGFYKINEKSSSNNGNNGNNGKNNNNTTNDNKINTNNHVDKRNKMLKKIKADRDRSQQIKQQDIFYITKYANKFNIDTKKLLQ